MQKDLLTTTALSAASDTDDPLTPTTKPIDNRIRSEWNNYISWLDKKGMKGHPSLDHGELGFKMIDEYKKEHPDSPLSKEMVIPIQQEFSKYRNYALNKIKSGKGAFGPGVTEENFMRALSVVDGIPGQRTTSFSFPSEYLKTFEKGKEISNQRLGYDAAK